jgi:hypothetical protein
MMAYIIVIELFKTHHVLACVIQVQPLPEIHSRSFGVLQILRQT